MAGRPTSDIGHAGLLGALRRIYASSIARAAALAAVGIAVAVVGNTSGEQHGVLVDGVATVHGFQIRGSGQPIRRGGRTGLATTGRHPVGVIDAASAAGGAEQPAHGCPQGIRRHFVVQNPVRVLQSEEPRGCEEGGLRTPGGELLFAVVPGEMRGIIIASTTWNWSGHGIGKKSVQ